MFFRVWKNKLKLPPSERGLLVFLQVLALVLTVFFVAKAPLQALASNGSLNILYYGEPPGTNTTVFTHGGKIPLVKLSNQTLANIKVVTISIKGNHNISIPVRLNETIECNNIMIALYPSNSKLEAKIIECSTVSESLAYIKLVLPGISRKDIVEESIDAGILRNNNVISFPRKLVAMSLKNSTISLPPAKCNSPDELLLRSGDYVYFTATTRDNGTYALVIKIMLPGCSKESSTLHPSVNDTLYQTRGETGASPENIVTTNLPAYGVKEQRDPYTIVFSAMIIAGTLILIMQAVRKTRR